MVTTRGRSVSTLVEQPQLVSPHKHQANGDHHSSSPVKSIAQQAVDSRLRKKRLSYTSSTNVSPEVKRRRTHSRSSSPVTRSSPLLEDPSPRPKRIGGDEVSREDDSTQEAQKDELVVEEATSEAKQELGVELESAEETAIPASTLIPQLQPAKEEAPTTMETAPDAEDIVAQAAKAAEAALLGYSQSETPNTLISRDHSSNTSPTMSEAPQTQVPTTVPQSGNIIISTSNPPQSQQTQHPPSQHQSLSDSLDHTPSSYTGPPNQTQPTAVLYERARRNANSKITNNPRNPATSASQRRPWTVEEERALMDGLDQVRGPFWSQILILYGPGGSINETLRDRTQVQLKDKARNLKLFFLKSRSEVPYYLSFVTGDLRSRTSTHGAAGSDATSQSATSAPSRQSNGSSQSAPAAGLPRTRYPPASITQPRTIPAVSSILPFPPPNSVYTSPYAPIRSPLNGLSPNNDQESSMVKTSCPQDVADLASSAAAQVAASLMNFTGLDIPDLDLSTALGMQVGAMENNDTAQFSLAALDSQTNGTATQNDTTTGSLGNTHLPHHSNSVDTSVLLEGIKTFDTH